MNYFEYMADYLGGSISSTKLVDLTEHYDTSQSRTFSDVLIGLLASGGGNEIVEEIGGSFWQAVKTNRPIRFKVNAMEVAECDVYFDALSVSRNEEGEPTMVTSCFFASLTDSSYRASVLFGKYGPGKTQDGRDTEMTWIALSLEQISF